MTDKIVLPNAFVIMPFSPDFNEIYNLFIASTLSEVGYNVFRADDIVSQRNILEDIISSIYESDLIVADLTGSNPNVYYELGIAHTFGKPVILLSQSVSDLPFDLRSYRVIQYNTHFSAIADAKNRLKEFALQAKEGKLLFGNPIIDFGTIKNVDLKTVQPTPATLQIDNSLGLLDHIVLMEEGFSDMAKAINEITKRMNKSTEETRNVTNEMNKISETKEKNIEKFKRVHKLFDDFANSQEEYAKVLKEENDKFEISLDKTFLSLEFVVTSKNPKTDEERKALTDLVSSLTTLESNSQVSLQAFMKLLNTLKNTPKMQKNLSSAMDKVIIQIERFIGHTQQVIALSSKSISNAQKLLEA